jgi:enamine deaminase RidA (YjgF/YER057c/UK114 family)
MRLSARKTCELGEGLRLEVLEQPMSDHDEAAVPNTSRSNDPYERLKSLSIDLPKLHPPVGNFAHAVQYADLLFVSGQGPRDAQGRLHTGKVGATVSTQEAYEHARLTGVNLLAVIHETLGSLARVRRVVKLLGLVNASLDFTQHPKVINGCSDLLIDVFGTEIGRHARSAIGVASLPGQITVEIELIVAVYPST